MIQFVMAGIAAAGFITSVWSQQSGAQKKRRALRRDEDQTRLRMQQDRISSNEQALFQIEQLSETLATQRAMMAVRGGLPGVGSNLAITEKSLRRFNRDEEARLMSLEFGNAQQEYQMQANRMALRTQQSAERAGQIMGGLNTASAFFGGSYGGNKKPMGTASSGAGKQPGMLTPQQRNPDYSLYPKRGR